MDFTIIVGIVLKNLQGYDAFILVCALVNFYFFYLTLKRVRIAEGSMYPKLDRGTSKKNEKSETPAISENEVKDLTRKCIDINKSYSAFVNITSIFPMLGILGTVFALIVLVGGDSDITQQSFFIALTSTGWGVIFSIIFKSFFDSIISPRIERINDDLSRKKQQYGL